jgi:DNA polymerase elongation subunit (family B)
VLPFVKDGKECNIWGNRLAEELTALFPPPLKLEFEKAMRVIFLAKKKYAALLINKDGSFSKNILIRGIVLARRDNCSFLRETYEALLKKILYQAGPIEIYEDVFRALIRAFKGQVEPEKFEVVKSLGSSYKQKNFSMAVFSEECAKFGRPAQPGDRLGYVIVTQPSSIPAPESGIKINNLGLRMRLTEVWKEMKSPDIDTLYYTTNMFMNPFDQLISVRFKDELIKNGVAKAFSFKPRKSSEYSCVFPIKMFCSMVKQINSKRPEIISGEDMAKIAEEFISAFKMINFIQTFK